MDATLKQYIDNYNSTNWESLLREDLGKHHLKEIKPDLDYIKFHIDSLVSNINKFSPNQLGGLTNFLNFFIGLKKRILDNRDTGQNQTLIEEVSNLKQVMLDYCQRLFLELNLQDQFHSIKNLKGMNLKDKTGFLLSENTAKLTKQWKESLQNELKEVKKLHSSFKDLQAEREASKFGDIFTKEAKKNGWWSVVAGVVLLLFSVFACWLAYEVLKFNEENEFESFIDLLIKGGLIYKAFIFSIILIIISLLRKEYLALRHQYTLNKHRQNSINSHKEIVASIQETATENEKEISNAILLEVTKAIFSHQDTGFVKDQKDASSENRVIEISKSLLSPK